jgi:superfamily II DNA or RNA helicase
VGIIERRHALAEPAAPLVMTVLDILRPLTTHHAQQRGWQYLNRVHRLTGDSNSVSAEVEGQEIYDVEIRLDGQNLRVWCSCPYFADRATGCKHLWATAVLAVENGWLTSLRGGVSDVIMDFAGGEDFEFGVLDESDWSLRRPPQRTPQPPDWAVALAAVTPSAEDLDSTSRAASQLVYLLIAPPQGTVTELPLDVLRIDRRPDGAWTPPRPALLAGDAIAHLPDADDRWALSLIHGAASRPRGHGWQMPGDPYLSGTTYLNGALLDLLLPRLCPTGRVRLRYGHRTVPAVAEASGERTIGWDAGEMWRLVLKVDEIEGVENDERGEGTTGVRSFRVDALLARSDARASIHQFALLTDSLAVLDGVVARFDPAGGFAWAAQLRARGPLVIPADSQRALVESLARSAVEHVEVPDALRWEERVVAPQFVATIGRPDGAGTCHVEAVADYDGTRAPLAQGSARVLSDDGRVIYRRDRAAESAALALLSSGRSDRQRPLTSVSYRKVPALVRTLLDAGWTVLAEGLRYRALAAPRLRIRSGIDWFALDTLGDQDTPIDLADLQNAVRSGRRTVTLGDGSIGMLPEQWLARVAPVLALGEADGASIRFKPSQVALIDALIAAQPDVDWDEGFARAVQAIGRFEGVRPEDAPPSFRGELRDYQREALGWMRFLRDFGFGGCLADDMGLGKTVMVLAMLESRRADPSRRHRPSLIVMPRSLIFNWTSEAARFAPELRVLDFAHGERQAVADEIASADAVLITYGTLRRDIGTLKDREFDYVVLDEAQAIKNAGTATAKAVRLLRADHRLALTGTPIENHLGELYSLFEFLNPGLLGSGRVLDAWRLAGATNSPEFMARLAAGLRPFFLRRTKEHVTPELPPRTDETLYCELEGDQRRAYDRLRQHYQHTLLQRIDRDGLIKSRFAILEALLRLRQAACHTGLLRIDNGSASAKFDLLLPRLGELIAEGRKALVFSQFTSLLALLRAELDRDRVAYEYLDGQTRDREARVAKFQQDPACPLFLISLKAGGVGLNLTAAEYVFLLDPWWNPAVEMQAIDRTHRIGQQKPVFAYRLVARDTVEERILELQASKRALADAILDAGTGGLRGLEREDLERLLA